MYNKVLLAAGLSFALMGCAAPLVAPNPLTVQSKVTHATDWKALARRAVEKLPTTVHGERPSVYVMPAANETPFTEAYTRFLEEALYDRNYPVVKSPAGAGIVIRSDVQWLLYDPANKKQLHDYATLYTTAVAVGAQLRHVSRLDTGLGIGLAAGPVVDFLVAMDGGTNAEVIVATSVADGSHAHYAGSEIFYVRPSDLTFYLVQPPPPTPMDLAVVSLPVSGDRH